MAENLAKYLPI